MSGFKGADAIELVGFDDATLHPLAYKENAAGTGGVLRVTDGTHTAELSFLGDYTASSFIPKATSGGVILLV
jgi:hypothetical protein